MSSIAVQQAKTLIEGGMSQRKAARAVGIAQSTLSEALKREGFEPPTAPQGPDPAGVMREGTDVTITTPAREAPVEPPDQRTGEELLRKHGYDPAEYVITSVRVSEWGNPESLMFQHRVNATRKDNMLVIPDLGKDFVPWEYGQIEEYSERRVALIPDLHAPYHDEAALRAVCELLAAERPEQVIFLGDVADFSILSRHRTHHRFAADINTTNQAVTDNFRRVREAVPNAQIIFLPGNHDARLLYAVQDTVPELARVSAACLPGETKHERPLGFEALWRLRELGIELVDEDWKLAYFAVTPELDARHGYLTGNNSERKLLEKHGRSQVHGHTHRGSLTYRTKHDPLDIRVSMDCGTLSEIKRDGIGYEPAPDWTPGIGWVHIWSDGLFQLSFLPFIKHKLLTPWGVVYAGD